MPRVVLRVGKRRTSWETGDVETIVQTEFKQRDGVIDLRPSVYVLDGTTNEAVRNDVVRIVAEHTASFLDDPPKGTSNLDLEGLAVTRPTPGESKFTFANAHHHEVPFDGVEELRAMVGHTLADIGRRKHAVSRDELLAYAAGRRSVQDPEWASALAGRDEWLKLLRKR